MRDARASVLRFLDGPVAAICLSAMPEGFDVCVIQDLKLAMDASRQQMAFDRAADVLSMRQIEAELQLSAISLSISMSRWADRNQPLWQRSPPSENSVYARVGRDRQAIRLPTIGARSRCSETGWGNDQVNSGVANR